MKLTIAGKGGVGKTTIAATLAREPFLVEMQPGLSLLGGPPSEMPLADDLLASIGRLSSTTS